MPIDKTVASYGVMGTRSAAMTVMVWLSIINLKCVSTAALTSLMRYDLPEVKVVLYLKPPLSYVFVPLIKALSRVGGPSV